MHDKTLNMAKATIAVYGRHGEPYPSEERAYELASGIVDMHMDLTIAMAALREACNCADPERSPPTDWGRGHAHLPHHCDCPMYAIELPDADVAPTAYADAMKLRERFAK